MISTIIAYLILGIFLFSTGFNIERFLKTKDGIYLLLMFLSLVAAWLVSHQMGI